MMIRRSALFALMGLVLAACTVVPNAGTATDMGVRPSNAVSETTVANVANPVDADVLAQLIAQHTQAIDLANQALPRAKRQDARTLAATIIETQGVELRRMQAWQSEWFPNRSPAVAAGPATTLPNAASVDEGFLAALIPLYEQGIETARNADGKVQNGQLQTLIKTILIQQSDQLDRFKRWQTEWAQAK